MQLGSLVGFGLVFVVVAWGLSLLSIVALRAGRHALRRLGPAAERRAVELAAVIPVILGVAIIAILLLASATGVDHCYEHHHEAHFCVRHGGPWVNRTWAVSLVALAGIAAIVRTATLAATIVRRRRTVARLRRMSHHTDGIWWVDSPDAICFVAGFRDPEVFVSTGTWNALDEDERAAMLAHEHAHIRHHDIVRRLVVDVLSSVGAPVASLIRALWDSATERLCDARAAAETGSGESVASAMVKVCRLGVRARIAPSFPPSAHAVEERVAAVLADGSAGDRAARFLLAIVAVTLSSIVLAAVLHASSVHDALEALLG